ncbi:protein kinase domain-containing protein [Amycolatopsis azurea]|uniref:Serine/threonine protein kinase n=1 Tax=Amycolatopsis azurea DSM 43854 TaxID=1238180 RepID=M2NRR7_9PSEU|nr:protein kinase [Amycolatopsis azurea]EMD25014.1 serine/threonine protein kinase [Amycolatopsis azurea DSM 43854]OOC05286.1 serine/threonine protein kinase [Amycolatopsis azurea DSM 43854]
MDDWTLPGFTEMGSLGEGGFGRVVLARHDESAQVVAVKYLYAKFAADPQRLAEFRQEAHVLSRVSGPHIARLHQFVETPQGAAIIMEAVHGISLKEILGRQEKLEPEAALAILKGSLLGLAGAHAAGTVHRDYKPANVLVTREGQSKLVDFGIAVLAGQAGVAAGTPAYMAPEQWAGGIATPATDVYAATCVFFQCVAGHKPYEAEQTEVLRTLHEYAPIPFGEVPEPVRDLIARGMAKDVTQRPSGAAEFVAELESSARKAYGEDWERNGWHWLAKGAGVLVALSPLALLGAGTAAAPVVAGGAAGGVAVTTGGGIAVGLKVTAAVAAVTAAAVGTVVVINANSDDPPATTLSAMKVDLLTRTEKFDGFDYNGKYVRISGLKDKAAEDRVNKALMAPIDGWLENFWPDSYQPQREPDGDIPHMKTEAEILRQDDKLVSVVYKRSIDSTQFGNHGGFSVRPIVIDLTKGEQISGAHLFDNVDGTAARMRKLEDLILDSARPGDCLSDKPTSPEHLPATALSARYTFDYDSILQAAPTANGMRFYVYGSALGYPRVCDPTEVTTEYARLTDLMSPSVKNLLGLANGGTQGERTKEDNVGAFTITTPEKWWLLSSAPIERYLVTAEGCSNSGMQPFHCAGVVFSDNSRVDAATPAYEPGKPYNRSTGPRPCHSVGAPGETQGSPIQQKKDLRPVGTKKAAYEEWRLMCSGGGTVIQRVWFLPKTQLVIVDEWNTPGLDKILEEARWN